MKKLITLFSLVFAFAVFGQKADTDGNGKKFTEEMKQEHFNKMFAGVNLTADQKAQLKTYFNEKHESRMAKRSEWKDKRADFKKDKAKMKTEKGQFNRNKTDKAGNWKNNPNANASLGMKGHKRGMKKGMKRGMMKHDDGKIKEILTPEQFEKFQENKTNMMKERRSNMRELKSRN